MSDTDLAALLQHALTIDADGRFDVLHEIREHNGLESLAADNAFVASQLLAASGDPSDLPNVARLSLQAHQDEIDGAGLLHAEASDKIALYTGRPQLYGTVMLEHQGDIVQPPVDKRVSDDERAALGVPPLAELQTRMQTMSRKLAIERAEQPGWLPAGQRFCRVWTEPDPAELRARMEREGASAWADDDIITFVTESDTPVTIAPVFPIESWDAGDGLQVLSLRVERLDEAVITYTFAPTTGMGAMNFSRGSHDGRFRGVNSPPELASNDPLKGTTCEHAVESDSLGEPRRVTVYRPPATSNDRPPPVIYATDGNMFAPYARRLDAAIEAGICPPVTVVAAHAASFDPVLGNLRATEYLPGFDDSRYEAHQKFFINELSAWAEAELGVPVDPSRRGVFGCSDGGGHAVMIARLFPERYGHIFAYSTGMPVDLQVEWTDQHPFMHLCAGTLEGPFHQATESWAGYLMLQDARYHFTERVAGHDLVQWAEELPLAISRAWG